MIAKMDSTANEIEEVTVKGYPTIMLYQRGKKDKPIEYTGKHDMASI